MIKEFVNGFVSSFAELCSVLTPHCFYILGRMTGFMIFIFLFTALIIFIIHILGLDKNSDYDYYDFM